jgi:hypothetical protein
MYLPILNLIECCGPFIIVVPGQFNLNHFLLLITNVGALLEIMSFVTSHYATGMQLIIICNYLGDVCNYKFGIV